MTIQETRVIYVMDCGAELMDRIRRECSHWADGDSNICITSEDAREIPELEKALSGMHAYCDVICSQ